MSTDYYLYSKGTKMHVQVGSVGLSGIQSYPHEQDVVHFIRWAIEYNIKDIVLMSEHEIDAIDGWPDDEDD